MWEYLRRRLWFRLSFINAKAKMSRIKVLSYFVGDTFKNAGVVWSNVSTCINDDLGYGELENRLICWETPSGITVWLDGKPACAMGFELIGKRLCIRQLQGVAGVQFPVECRNWPRLFIQAAIDFAQASGLEEVRLYRAHMCLFYEDPVIVIREGVAHNHVPIKLYRQKMRRRYDGTARQLGFEMLHEYGRWLNPLYVRPS